MIFFFFFFNDTATTEIYTLSLHDALPISRHAECPDDWDWSPRQTPGGERAGDSARRATDRVSTWAESPARSRSEEHTSELQSQSNLVCRLLLEKKKKRQHLSSKLV